MVHAFILHLHNDFELVVEYISVDEVALVEMLNYTLSREFMLLQVTG